MLARDEDAEVAAVLRAHRRSWRSPPAPAMRDGDVLCRTPRPLAEREPGECCFPIGPVTPEGEAHRQLFCCEPVGDGDYCAKHARRVYPKGK